MSELSFREIARLEIMLRELESNEHKVVLVTPDEERHTGHKVRALQSANAAWYTKFNQNYMNARGKMKRARTFMKKVDTIHALERMLNGNTKGIMAERLINFVRQEIANEDYKRELESRIDDDEYMPF